MHTTSRNFIVTKTQSDKMREFLEKRRQTVKLDPKFDMIENDLSEVVQS